MSRIVSKEHFANYLNKVVRENQGDYDQDALLPLEFYIRRIYDPGLADLFTNDIWRIGVALLEKDNTIDWIDGMGKEDECKFPSIVARIGEFTPEFRETVSDLESIPGVYSFWDMHDRLLYIGKSIDLQSRIISSYKNMIYGLDGIFYARILITPTESDAEVVEAYLIAKLKPSFNVNGKHPDGLTYTMKPEPSLIDQPKIQINSNGTG